LNRFLFVVNPEAGRGLGRKTGARLERQLQRDNFRYDLVYTTQPGEACSKAREADVDVVVAVGGDGTINEVVNGIFGSSKKLAIIAAGSGNDVVKSLGVSHRLEEALQVLSKPDVRIVDTASIQCTTVGAKQENSQERIFVNGAGMGFDASVARKAATIPFLRGTLLYLVAVLRTLGNFRSPDFQIHVDGSQTLAGRKLLVAIGNGQCAGGGFYLTPRASVVDGLLDMCVVSAMGIGGILNLIPRVLKGNHLSLKDVEYVRGRAFSISSADPFSVHADGEIVAESATHVNIRVNPVSLKVLASG